MGSDVNPFNPDTRIRIGVPKPSHVTLIVYNILGHEIMTLIDEHLDAGHHWKEYSGTDKTGTRMPNGIYIFKMNAGNFMTQQKCALVK